MHHLDVSSSRHRLALIGAALLTTLFLSGCSPLDQGAVTLDESTQMPKLVLALCGGEGVEAVRLSAARVDDGIFDEGRTLWRIEAKEPQPITSIVAGQVPEGFREVTPLAPDLPATMVMVSENGGDGGVASEHGIAPFNLSELEPGVLMRDGDRISMGSLRQDARRNCSSGIADQFGFPAWLDVAAAIAVGAAALTGLGLWLHRYRRRRSAPTG